MNYLRISGRRWLRFLGVNLVLVAMAGKLVAKEVVVPQMVPGWRIELMLASPRLNHPSVVCSAPDGRVFVAEDPMDIQPGVPAEATSGRILCLHPDGHLTVFAEALHAVFGMQYLEGNLYVLHNPKFSRFTDDHGVGRDRMELIQQTTPRPWALDWNDHVPANFRLGMDGYFYVAVGDKGLYGTVGRDGSKVTLHGGGILRLRPDGTRLEVVSSGVRNIMDVALNAFDDRFTYDNTDEHDWMGRLTHMVDRGFYGYPHDFIPRRPYTLWMMHDFGGGAATGIECDNGAALPSEFHGNLFLGDFGKRQILRVQIERAGATYRRVHHQELFVNPPASFRPVGIAWSADERSLWICDWAHRDTKEAVQAGRLWRATRDDAKAVSFPTWYVPAASGKTFEATDEQLAAGLGHPSRSVRLTAQRRLIERRSVAVRRRVARVAEDSMASETARVHALWALEGLSPDSAKALAERWVITVSVPLEGRIQAARILGDFGDDTSRSVLETVVAGRREPAALRFHAATALGRLHGPHSVTALLNALEQEDAFARFAAFTALREIGQHHPMAWESIVAGLGDSREPVRQGTTFGLRETWDSGLTEALLKVLNRSPDLAVRLRALELLVSMARLRPAWDGGWWAYHPALSPAPEASVDWAGTSPILTRLMDALEDPAAELRRAAIEGLREVHESSATPAILRRLAGETDLEVRRSAARALGTFHRPEASAWLVAQIGSVDSAPELIRDAIAAAVELGGKEAVPSIERRAGAPGPVRAVAVAALGTLKAETSVPVLAAAAAAEDSTVRAAAIRALGNVRGQSALEVLVRLSQSVPEAERPWVVQALGALQMPEAVPQLLALWRERATREAALDALTLRGDVRAVEAYLEGLGQVNSTVRERSRKVLRAVRDESLQFVESRVAGLPARVVLELREVYQGHARATNGVVFTRKVAVATPDEYARFAMEHPGDPVAGQRVFWDAAGVACIRCHAVAGQGSSLGPDMTAIGAQFGRRELIENVLYPSRSVREGYQQVLIETKDGESLGGIVRSETAEAVTLVDALGQLHPVAKSSIVHRETSPLSLMPEGLQSGLTREQFADLIGFLESRRTDPRTTATTATTAAPTGWAPLLAGASEGVPNGWVELPAGTKRVDGAMLQRGRPAEHWQLKEGILEHDGLTGDLWTTRDFGDLELSLEWRWTGPFTWEEFPLINADGLEAGPDGRAATARVLDAGDSGVLLRGLYKAQANLFCYPVGSGEFWEYRTDSTSTPAQRRAFTPRRNADRPLGDWNEMRIRLRGNQVSVTLNGEEVIHEAELPGLPARGPIGLQHEHGRLQFRNLFLRELPPR